MQVIETIGEFRAARHRLSGTLGLVPTMGFLHEGHMTLVKRARVENDHVAVSIFVNPAQFGPNEDYAGYPRDRDRDLSMLDGEGTDLLFIPTAAEMYPVGFQTAIEVAGVSQGLEGERRPGHFRGVATVVGKLFNIVTPDRAYFGQKDGQQCAVIRQMVIDLAIPIQVVIVPTVRAPDGLALSSRNSYLTPEQRRAAPVLYRALSAARECYKAGSRSADELRAVMRDTLAAEPLATIDYVSVADALTLREIPATISGPVMLSMAVRLGRARLIDNLLVGP
ncbi:MAG TPA: pantoate--beta-alanine ligase [Aggregatilineales bacterium]|nr:pantoate--beta-alanine ligase [Aggregatilineales bacterium]